MSITESNQMEKKLDWSTQNATASPKMWCVILSKENTGFYSLFFYYCHVDLINYKIFKIMLCLDWNIVTWSVSTNRTLIYLPQNKHDVDRCDCACGCVEYWCCHTETIGANGKFYGKKWSVEAQFNQIMVSQRLYRWVKSSFTQQKRIFYRNFF